MVHAVAQKQLTGWEAVVNALAAERIPYVFGLPGDPGHLFDALVLSTDPHAPKPFGVRHETSGALMAMAFARVTNQMAACFGCPGPGIANLVPGILEAFSGCTPMLILGVRASRQTNGMGAFQETDHLGMLSSITKWATTVEVPERINWTIRRAVQLATTGRPGPVYVELPGDIGMGRSEQADYTPSVGPLRPGPDPAAIAAAADLLAGAKHPLLVTGGGTILSGAGDAVTGFIDRFGIPVQTTPAGRGSVQESHPLFTGLVGLYRTTLPRAVYEEADVIITVGSRMEEFQGGFNYVPEWAKIIQIEIDSFEVGRNWRPDVAIQADARLAVEALGAELSRRGVARNDGRAADISTRRDAAIAAARAEVDATLDANRFPFSGMTVINEANRVFGANTIICQENGGQDLWSYYWPYYQVLDQGCCVPPAEQTVMGYGIIGAMAAKLAAPDRQVIVTCGDGSFMMSIHELGTAVQEKLPVTWIVLNDSAFGWVQWIQRRAHDGRIVATQFDPPIDIVATARAAGCDSVRVERPQDLGAALLQAKAANEIGIPFVIDIPVDQSHHHAEFDRYHGYEPAPGSATA